LHGLYSDGITVIVANRPLHSEPCQWTLRGLIVNRDRGDFQQAAAHESRNREGVPLTINGVVALL
jgi:hypothetical protein